MKSYEWVSDDASCLDESDPSNEEEESQVLISTEIEGGDFSHAGKGSSKLREAMKKLGIPHDLVKRSAISAYEAEMNVVIHSTHGTMTSKITQDRIHIEIEDQGEGIDDLEKALQPGYSTATEEVREMGFGAGLGFTNIRRNSDKLVIETEEGEGTYLSITLCL